MSRQQRKKHGRKRFRRQAQPGAAPGTIIVQPQAAPPKISAIAYSHTAKRRLDVNDPEEAVKLRAEGELLWVDVRGMGDANLIKRLGELFQLHPLALEDAVNVHQQAKVEAYGDQLFVVLRAIETKMIDEDTMQISMFVGKDFILTLQEGASDKLKGVRKRIDGAESQVRTSGIDFLAYTILDVVIDRYFPLVEQCGEQLDELEDRIVSNPPRSLIHDLHSVRNVLRSLRRVTWQHREAVNALMDDSTGLVAPTTLPFLRDCHDHTIQLVDLLEIYRETCSDLRDVYLSSVSHRMNEIMMVLTVISTIFIPLSFIAGIYGMNFNTTTSPWNMPELNWIFGYPMALLLMATIAIGMLIFFRNRGWILQSSDEEAPPRADESASPV